MTLAIDVHDVQFAYDQQTVLSIPAWQLAAQQRCLLMGPSGSGKSTLLHLLSGMSTPQQGRIHVLGHDLTGMSARQRDRFRAQHLGFISQHLLLLPYLTVFDNLRISVSFGQQRASHSRQALRDRARHSLQQLQLDPRLLDRRADQLSVGQQQRVAIARAFIHQPALIIADEPTSALDDQARDAFLTLLHERLQESNATLLMVSHDARMRPWFDQCVPLTELNRAAGGTHAA